MLTHWSTRLWSRSLFQPTWPLVLAFPRICSLSFSTAVVVWHSRHNAFVINRYWTQGLTDARQMHPLLWRPSLVIESRYCQYVFQTFLWTRILLRLKSNPQSWVWRDVSGVKSTGCSAGGSGCVPSSHNCLFSSSRESNTLCWHPEVPAHGEHTYSQRKHLYT